MAVTLLESQTLNLHYLLEDTCTSGFDRIKITAWRESDQSFHLIVFDSSDT